MYEIPYTPAPRNTIAPSTWQPPTAAEMIQVAAAGDAMQARQLQNRITGMAMQDEMDKRAYMMNALAPQQGGGQQGQGAVPGVPGIPPVNGLAAGGQQGGMPSGQGPAMDPGAPSGGAPMTYGAMQGAQELATFRQTQTKARWDIYKPAFEKLMDLGDGDKMKAFMDGVAKTEPLLAPIVQNFKNMQLTGPNKVSGSGILTADQLKGLSGKASGLLQDQIAGAEPGKAYEYKMEAGRVTEFKPVQDITQAYQDIGTTPDGKTVSYNTKDGRRYVEGEEGKLSPYKGKVLPKIVIDMGEKLEGRMPLYRNLSEGMQGRIDQMVNDVHDGEMTPVAAERSLRTLGANLQGAFGDRYREKFGAYDESQLSANAAWYKRGQTQQYVRRAKSALSAMDEDMRLARMVDNPSVVMVNKLTGAAKKQFSDSKRHMLDMGNLFTADELNQILGGSGGAVEYFKALRDQLDTNVSVDAYVNMLKEARAYLGMRVGEYVKGTPGYKEFKPILEKIEKEKPFPDEGGPKEEKPKKEKKSASPGEPQTIGRFTDVKIVNPDDPFGYMTEQGGPGVKQKIR